MDTDIRLYNNMPGNQEVQRSSRSIRRPQSPRKVDADDSIRVDSSDDLLSASRAGSSWGLVVVHVVVDDHDQHRCT